MIRYCEDFAAKRAEDLDFIKYSMTEAIRRRSPHILDNIGISIHDFSSMTEKQAMDAVDKYCKHQI